MFCSEYWDSVVDLDLFRSGSVFRVWLITRQSHALTPEPYRCGIHNDVFCLLVECHFPLSPGLLAKGYVCIIYVYCYDSPVLHAAQSADLVHTLRRLFLVLATRKLTVVSFWSQPGRQQ